MSHASYTQHDRGPAAPAAHDPTPPTYAAFSPTNISGSSLTSRQRSTIIVHRKSPLLVATPPAVTRALAYSHPFLLPLNRLAGLLSWTSGDPWESFLLLAGFWAIVLYGKAIILWAGPILVVIGLILGMYSRRYSPLSSTGLTGEKHGGRDGTEGPEQHHKSLDEIVETLRSFTTRCNILLEPFLELTDFLSTQRTATSTTTRPALTALLGRIVLVTPIWILLTLSPFRIITIRRVVLIVGTIILTWHSKPARISRVILWRSLTVRRICSALTGLSFSPEVPNNDSVAAKPSLRSSIFSFRPFRHRVTSDHATDIATKRRRVDSSGVRFTFILYENQRRWLGIGWTYSLFAYERGPWTDEHLNTAPSKDEFELPGVPGGNARWRWVAGSEWRVDGTMLESTPKKSVRSGSNDNGKGPADDGGWIYYDNKWNDGRRGQDSWGRYTRRRKWCRDAELVEVTSSTESTQPPSPDAEKALSSSPEGQIKSEGNGKPEHESKDSISSTATKARKKRWFGSSDLTKAFASPNSATASAPNLSNTEPNQPANTEANATQSSSPPSIRGASYNDSLQPRSFDSGASSGPSSIRRRRAGSRTNSMAGAETDRESLTLSLREKEIEEERDKVDQWRSQGSGPAEGAGRRWALGDDAQMGLS